MESTGSVIYLKGNTGFCMSEMVYVGREKLVGEVIALDKDMTTIQVYEETTGLRPGEEVIATGNPVSVTLAPGILNNIFDGIERPLERIAESGERLSPAVFPLTLWIKRKCRPHHRFCGRLSPRRRYFRRSTRNSRDHA